MSDAFEVGSGFSVAWVHNVSLLITGVIVLVVASILVLCLVHKLSEGVIAHGDILLWAMIFIVAIATVILGVLQSM